MDVSSFETIKVEASDGVVRVWLNRPRVRNAMSLQMVHELLSLCETLGDEGARVLVLRGAGGHFCAGGDITDMAQARMLSQSTAPGDVDPFVELNLVFGRLIRAIEALPLVVVTVAEGAVLGGGLGLVCVSDIAIVEKGAVFGLPETSLGVIPAQIAPFVVKRVGMTQARRMALLGERFKGERALLIGLVHYVEDGEVALGDRLKEVLNQVMKCAPSATAVTKRLLLDTEEMAMGPLLERAAVEFAQALRSDEGMEGALAFMEKRKPCWQTN